MQNLAVTDKSFKDEVLDYKGVVIVDMWAPWCFPCQMLGPIIEEIAEENKGKVKVCKLNVDENPQTAQKYQVMSIPMVLLLQNGEVKETLIGVQPKSVYQNIIEKYIK